VILRRDKGVVYVELWENLVDRPDSSRDPGPKLAQPREINA
jgi:hypothetical protein